MSASQEKELAVQMLELQIATALEKGVSFSTRVIQLVGEVNENMFCFLDACLTLLEEQSKRQITIRLHSHGGDSHSGMAIASRIKASPCKIIIEAYGSVMSAATLIMASGTVRKASKFSIFMVHESAVTIDGKTSEIKAFAKQMNREEDLYCHMMAELTGTQFTVWRAMVDEGIDKYLSAQEALKYNLIHKIF